MVVMHREDYIDKAKSLIADITTYKTITKDPTNKLKNKLTQTLRDIKNQGRLSDYNYRKVYTTSAVAPKLYGLPKIHKVVTSLRPIVSSRGSMKYGLPRSWPTLFAHSLASPHTISKTLNMSYNTSRR